MAVDEPIVTDGPSLPLLASKRFPHSQPIKFPFTAYCSSHDLLAIVNTNNDISVFRITSGQVAFSVKRENAAKKGIEVTTISWKANGTCLGVGWSDGKYGIYDGGTGKQLALVELENGDAVVGWRLGLPRPDEGEGEEDQRKKNEVQGDGEEEGDERIYARAEVMGWMGHDADGSAKSKKSSTLTTDDWLDGLEEGMGNVSISSKTSGPKLAQLSRAITTLDVTKALPRLSAVQNHITKPAKGMGKTQKVTSVWQTQQGTDSIFEVGKDLTAQDTVESLLVCQGDGKVQVLIDETVRVGSCDIAGKPLLHAAHPNSSSHAILSRTEDSTYLNIIDLPLSTLSGPLLHVIATNTKRMQTLLDYIVQTIRCVQYDYNHNIEVPARFMRSLGGFVESTDMPDVVANFYHLAMTGTFPDQLLEWLKDVLQDRGQKRWEEHMNDMYRHSQDHLFINLLPALDRFSIAVTTLRGHAIFYEGSTKFDCPPELFTNVLDQIDCLRLVAQKMLLIVQTEHRQFRAFNKWMKMQMEVAAAEPFTASALETEGREVPGLDYSLLLSYIKNVMTESKLAVHIQPRPGMEGQVSSEEFWANDIIRDMSYERAKEVLSRETDPKAPMSLALKDINDQTALLNLPAITCALQGHVRVALARITEWQSRMLTQPIQIGVDVYLEATIHDMTTTPTETRILSSYGEEDIQVPQLRLHTITNYSDPQETFFPFPIDEDEEILDAKLEGTAAVFTLSRTELRRLPISESEPEETLHFFPENAAFRPQSFMVGGRKGKRVVVVFGNKGREWRVLDLDAGVQMKGGGEKDQSLMEVDD